MAFPKNNSVFGQFSSLPPRPTPLKNAILSFQKRPDVHKIFLSIKLHPLPPPRKSVNFEDFILICTLFPHFGPFSGGGGKPNFADKNFMDTQTFLILLSSQVSEQGSALIRQVLNRTDKRLSRASQSSFTKEGACRIYVTNTVAGLCGETMYWQPDANTPSSLILANRGDGN